MKDNKVKAVVTTFLKADVKKKEKPALAEDMEGAELLKEAESADKQASEE